MALQPRFTTGSTGGADGGFGGGYLTNLLLNPTFPMTSASTPLRFVHIGLPMAEKGGKSSGHRTLAWRSDDENSRFNRWLRAGCELPADARERRGYKCRPGASGQPSPFPAAAGRPGIRCQQPAGGACACRMRGRHSLHPLPQTRHPLRQARLSRQKHDRTRVLRPQGFPPYCNSIRQTAQKLPRSHRNRCRHFVVDLIESRP